MASAPTSPTGRHFLHVRRNASAHRRSRHTLEVAGEVSRYLAALALVGVGAVHAQQYYEAYFYAVPTIGTLFLLSFIGATIVGAVLFAPMRRLRGRVGDLALVLAALGAIGIALGTLASLLISEYRPLFGFMESGYRLSIVLTLVFDGLTTVFLGAFLLIAAPALIHRTTIERSSS